MGCSYAFWGYDLSPNLFLTFDLVAIIDFN